MTLIGFRSSNHPQQTARRGPNEATDDRATHPDVFRTIDARFHFTVDVAASIDNTKCARYYTLADDGLAQSWAGERVWCNPPYSDITPWVRKAWSEWSAHNHATCIVMLLPANRTEQAWWQDLVEPYRDGGGATHCRVPSRPAPLHPRRSQSHRPQRTPTVRMLPIDLERTRAAS